MAEKRDSESMVPNWRQAATGGGATGKRNAPLPGMLRPAAREPARTRRPADEDGWEEVGLQAAGQTDRDPAQPLPSPGNTSNEGG